MDNAIGETIFSFRLRDEMLLRLKHYAADQDIPVGQAIRQLIANNIYAAEVKAGMIKA